MQHKKNRYYDCTKRY